MICSAIAPFPMLSFRNACFCWYKHGNSYIHAQSATRSQSKRMEYIQRFFLRLCMYCVHIESRDCVHMVGKRRTINEQPIRAQRYVYSNMSCFAFVMLVFIGILIRCRLKILFIRHLQYCIVRRNI